MKSEKTSPAVRYLATAGNRIRQMRSDLPKLIDFGSAMARHLLAGGNLFPSAVSHWWPSEFSGRAGGLMGIRSADYVPASPHDVAWLTVPDPRYWSASSDERFAALVKSPAKIFVNGRPQDVAGAAPAKRFSAFTGGAAPDDGWGACGRISPLVSFRPLEQIMRGWAAAGEMIGACIRGGRMPIIWMSVWLEGAFVRNAAFTDHNNLREPWSAPLFHNDRYIPPPAPGRIASDYLDFIENIRQVLLAQADKLRLAGRWLADARRAGRRVFAVLVGHSYPAILKPDYGPEYPVEFGPSASDLRRALPASLREGDVAVHLGYGPTQPEDVRMWVEKGVRLIHSTPYGRMKGVKDHKNLIWLDLPWRPGDACVDLPGYGVRLLPSSSAADTLAYFAIMAEMVQSMGW